MNNKDYKGHSDEHLKMILECPMIYYKYHLVDHEFIKAKYVEDTSIDYKSDEKFCELVKKLRERKEEIRVNNLNNFNENISSKAKG